VVTRVAIGVAALAALGVGCVNNPVHDQQVEALGPEDPAVPPGPLHRAGQPCVICHGAYGPASLEFSVAGTVYTTTGATDPAAGAVVRIEDIEGASTSAETNAAGNFYVLLQDFAPKFPILPQVSSPDGGLVREMKSYAARDGSCAGCHSTMPSASKAGPVTLAASPNDAGR
jgi:hypothetical protein